VVPEEEEAEVEAVEDGGASSDDQMAI